VHLLFPTIRTDAEFCETLSALVKLHKKTLNVTIALAAFIIHEQTTQK